MKEEKKRNTQLTSFTSTMSSRSFSRRDPKPREPQELTQPPTNQSPETKQTELSSRCSPDLQYFPHTMSLRSNNGYSELTNEE
jgi:hypothetical protein